MKIVVTLSARHSLKDIHDYYKENVSPRIADKIKSGISQKIKSIAEHPYIGQEEDNLKDLGLGFRRIVQGNYKIIYRILDNIIYITDIFDSRRDPSKVNTGL